jgi:protein-disulfide isomerase
MTRRRFILGSAIAAVLTAALTFATLPTASAQSKPDVPLDDLMLKGELPDNVVGNPDAPITIIEYSSMTCPHCADFHVNVLPTIKSKYIDTGKVKYIIREFPLDNVAATAAMLARCVEPAKFYDFVDMLYQRQKDWAYSDQPLPELQKLSKQAGFTEERFKQCSSDQKTLDYIKWVRDRGNKQFGVKATPSFFVNGKRVKGATTVQRFEEMIAAEAKS